MKWKIVTVGKPALSWAREAAAEYMERLHRVASVELVHIRDGSESQITERMLAAGEGCFCVALDERGVQRRSAQFAQWIKARDLDGTKRVCLFVGGANGHGEGLKKSVAEMWSLSSMTLQHEMALVVALEQIYRAHTILRGEPYHRE